MTGYESWKAENHESFPSQQRWQGRTEAALDVSSGQLCGCHKGAVLDAHAVEAGVLVCDSAQDLDCVLHARLLHLHLHSAITPIVRGDCSTSYSTVGNDVEAMWLAEA